MFPSDKDMYHFMKKLHNFVQEKNGEFLKLEEKIKQSVAEVALLYLEGHKRTVGEPEVKDVILSTLFAIHNIIKLLEDPGFVSEVISLVVEKFIKEKESTCGKS